jgi:DNA ligase-1
MQGRHAQVERRETRAPQLLIANGWDESLDPTGRWLSEKLDGVRAYWDAAQFLSRQGNRFHAPTWFTSRLPTIPLDGELWIGRKQFQRTVSIVRRQNGGELWRELRFVVFDAPQVGGVFEARLAQATELFRQRRPEFAQPLPRYTLPR